MKKKMAAQATARPSPRRSVKKPSVSAAKSTRAVKSTGAIKAREISRPTPRSVPRRELYPALEPYRHGYLRVSDVHEIYYEECGNPAGKPAIFLHGGPGAGSDRRARQFFDPRHYRIVVFDQRGCASILASSAGWFSADHGAAPWAWPMPRQIRSASPNWCCAESFCCATRK